MLSCDNLCGNKVGGGGGGGGAIECLHLKGFMVALTGQADRDRLKSSELEIYIVELKASSGETLTPTVQFLCP